MLYCYFIFESGKQGRNAAEDVKLQVFHLFQGTWQMQLTLSFDHDHTPCAFLHTDQLFLLMKACHGEDSGDLYLYAHISPLLYFYCKQAMNAKKDVSKYSCTAGSELIFMFRIEKKIFNFFVYEFGAIKIHHLAASLSIQHTCLS